MLAEQISNHSGEVAFRVPAGKQDYQRGHYKEAEQQFKAALRQAKGLGWYYFGGPERDPRLAAAINNLAELYRTQGRYSEAEPLFQRLASITEKLGNKHQGLPMSLTNQLPSRKYPP